MKRSAFLIQSSLVAGATLLGAPVFGNTQKAKRLTVLHTNDTHSQIEPLPNDGRAYAGMGGMARRANLIKQIRAQEENVLLLDAGDMFQGTPYFNYFGGEPEFKLMSAMGYDAITLGNHDFDNGVAGLERVLHNAQFSILNANYNFSQTGLRGKFKANQIFDKGGIKVGVFGLGIKLAGLVPDSLFQGIKYYDPIAVAKEQVADLKKQGAQLIICLSHLGYEAANDAPSDLILATQVSGIDLIIGGHTHTFLTEPKPVIHPETGHQTLINQVGWAGINLGRIDFSFTSKEKSSSYKSGTYEVK
jgi:5'-nucleotidase